MEKTWIQIFRRCAKYQAKNVQFMFIKRYTFRWHFGFQAELLPSMFCHHCLYLCVRTDVKSTVTVISSWQISNLISVNVQDWLCIDDTVHALLHILCNFRTIFFAWRYRSATDCNTEYKHEKLVIKISAYVTYCTFKMEYSHTHGRVDTHTHTQDDLVNKTRFPQSQVVKWEVVVRTELKVGGNPRSSVKWLIL